MKEKLIKLLCEAHNISTEVACFEDMTYAGQLRMEADHLIANGVTFREDAHWATEQAYKNGYEAGKKDAVVHGHWVLLAEFFDGSICTECSVCGEEYTYKKGRLELIGFEYAKYNYCPNCGARMDGDKHE